MNAGLGVVGVAVPDLAVIQRLAPLVDAVDRQRKPDIVQLLAIVLGIAAGV
jgi:hypothetical protein